VTGRVGGNPTVTTDLLRVEGLDVEFTTPGRVVRAVDGVSLCVRRGEVVALIGESGSGKTVTGLSILGLVDPPGRIVGGRVVFQGEDFIGLPESRLRRIRGDRIAMVFQDPLTALCPTLRIGAQMMNVLSAHRSIPRTEARAACRDALGKLGIPSPEACLSAYPHQLSGGMRQRVCIAMAMLNRPTLIVADEPTTALDVTTQAQILAEVRALRSETGTAFLWITHDLAVASHLADRIAVMYAGQIVEEGGCDEVLFQPRHPYTKALVDAASGTQTPSIEGSRARWELDGNDGGCRFRRRCPVATSRCFADPELHPDEGQRWLRCFHPLSPESHVTERALP
jgi:peptide/nickel transport system ATP-binding protein